MGNEKINEQKASLLMGGGGQGGCHKQIMIFCLKHLRQKWTSVTVKKGNTAKVWLQHFSLPHQIIDTEFEDSSEG